MNEEAYSILVYIIVGILAGWVAGLITKGRGFGLVLDMIFGIIGAFVGTWLLGGLLVPGKLGLFINAVIGAVIVIIVVSLIRKVTKNTPP